VFLNQVVYKILVLFTWGVTIVFLNPRTSQKLLQVFAVSTIKQKTNNPQPDCNTSDMDYSDDAGDAGLNQVLGWAFWNVTCDPSDKSCPS